MCWFAAGVAEVAGCGDDSAAEMVLPKAVNGDARRERVVATGDPAGQRQPAAVGTGPGTFRWRQVRLHLLVRTTEYLDEAGLDFFARRASVAADEDETLRRRTVVLADTERLT